MATNPLAEVFGFPIENQSRDAIRSRESRLCPFNNKVPNCTKDKANNPLGVCSVFNGDQPVITCPVRFREQWLIAEAAASVFFPPGTTWTSLLEVKLKDGDGGAAGNIDMVLVAYDEFGKIKDFGACEIQAVYISGNVREPFDTFMENHRSAGGFSWEGRPKYPRPDFLSSSRKRLAPQLLYKGGILNSWGKKQAVVVDKPFFETLPKLKSVSREEHDLAWLVYELRRDSDSNAFQLTHWKTVFTKFDSTLLELTQAKAGPIDSFIQVLQAKLDEKLDGNPPDAPILTDPELT